MHRHRPSLLATERRSIRPTSSGPSSPVRVCFGLGALLLLSLLSWAPAHAQIVITEFLAENALGQKDEDGDREDWIELHNSGTTPANLAGWSLTDNPNRPRAWTFPDLTLAPGEFLMVYASGKDRRTPGRPLHTNFKLSATGEYLALVRPNLTRATEFAPAYPPQVPDVAYGFPLASVSADLVGPSAKGRFRVPQSQAEAETWTQPGFVDVGWRLVTNGVGWSAAAGTNLVVVADSQADWRDDGTQGDRGWRYGTYARFLDSNGSYSASEFNEFGPGEWNGSRWRTPSAGTERAAIDATGGKPAGSNSGGERWVIRRWTATIGGELQLRWSARKRATGGSGASVRIYHNGIQRDTASLTASDTAGVTRTLTLSGVVVGDTIDLALTPTGSGGATDDVADEATTSLVISALAPLSRLLQTDVRESMKDRNASGLLRIPFVVTNLVDLEQLALRVRYDDGFAAFLNGTIVARRNAPVEATAGVVADSVADWSTAGEQGSRSWYYGYYDASGDPDRAYDSHEDFVNTAPGWNWNGTAWLLGPGDPPWTQIGREDWHPNGSAGGVGVHWAIRRWVSSTEGTVKVLFSGAKQNTGCGNGVTYRLLVNGSPRFTQAIGATDAVGFVTTVILEDLRIGDFVDFALDPTGPDGSTQDGCDGSTFHAQIVQDASAGLTWNSRATRERSDAEAVRLETFDLTRSRDLLVAGTNILAVQVLNVAPEDPDLLLLAELSGRFSHFEPKSMRYFVTPTPGNYNGPGTDTLGPVITEVAHLPNTPLDTEDLVIQAHVRPTLRNVATVNLAYRVMFGGEQTLPMWDDGRHDDGSAGDGVWAARIPASAASAGQMIRWAVTATDTGGQSLRFPAYPDPRRSPQYDGTVVVDPSLTGARIPVLHWFLPTPSSADNDSGARGSVFFEGEFYDNVLANLHGQSTRGFPKRSYDFDFNPGHKFRWRVGQPRVDDFNLLTTWADKSHLRNVLAYETYERAGAPAHFAFAVRVQQNGRFHSLANLVENGDDNFLARLGLDPQGALYKMYNTAGDVSGGEKKTRKTEGTQDLAALIAGCASGTSTARLAFLYDNLDVPEVINFLATRAITGDTDCCHKNYYLYRDTNGSREWMAFPWDVDLSFGRVWTCSSPCLSYFDETIYTNTGLFVGDGNTVFSLVLNSAPTRQMYLRRVRSLMDQLTQPPDTAPANDLWRLRTTQLRDQLAPTAALDLAKWGTWGRRETITQAVDRIHKEFLPGRRNYLYLRSVPGTLPQAQATNLLIRFAGLESRSTTGDPQQEYFSLTNANAVAVDISDWRVEGALRFRFKPGTVLPARSTAFVAANRSAFRARSVSPRGGESRFVLGNYAGDLSRRGGALTLLDPSGRTVHSTNLPASLSLAQRFLRITEIHFHPPDSDGATEFIELRNLGPEPLDLAGVRFVEGVRFDFTSAAISRLAPGASLVLVQNLAAFRARYGTAPAVAGTFEGSLDNAGERLRYVDADGETIQDFSFDPNWVPTTDGLGFSLVATQPEADPSASGQGASWRASTLAGGSPATADPTPAGRPVVVINEVLTHTDPPQLDAVELHNPSTETLDIGGWWLTDDAAKPEKFRIPAGTRIAPGSYVVIDESQFGWPTNSPTAFRLSSHGDSVWLFGTDTAGRLSGVVAGAEFEASANGVSFGRHTNSLGQVRFVPQRTVTLGAPNSGPRTGPVVFTEIFFQPPRGDAAFLELRNLGTSAVPFFDPAAPTNTWRLEGVDFDFPSGFNLPAGGTLLVVGGDPEQFRIAHGIPTDVPVLGPWNGNLQADGERIALLRPDSPDPLPGGGFLIPHLVVDEVRFRDVAPWPVTAATPGQSMERVSEAQWADDPANWRASGGFPTPGAHGQENRPPAVSAGSDQFIESPQFPLTLTLSGSASDDGRPSNPGRLTLAWTQLQGPGGLEITDPTRASTPVRMASPGRYVLRLTAFDGEWSRSAEVTLTIVRPSFELTAIAAGSTWRYFARAGGPEANWSAPDFEDANWASGAAQLGYGDGDERTTLPTTVAGAKLLTAYFRTRFVVSPPASVRSATARLLRDDGAAVWINGLPAFRSNLPDGPLTYATPATATVSGADESTYLEQALDPALFLAGTNVVAVEVHQQNEASSDLGFDFELTLVADADDATAYQTWVATRFTSAQQADPTVSGPGADPDADGQSNLSEFRSGTDPRDSRSVLSLTADLSAPGEVRLTFPATAHRTYRLLRSESPTAGGWQELRWFPPSIAPGERTFIDPVARTTGGFRFYRLVTP